MVARRELVHLGDDHGIVVEHDDSAAAGTWTECRVIRSSGRARENVVTG
jgi:hypothetical protein